MLLQVAATAMGSALSMGSATPHQIVMLGLENAGKTTLLYRLKLEWKEITHAIKTLKSDANGDPGYHYEELNSKSMGSYGIWDVPGTPEMVGMWPAFYRYVQVCCIIFVVDGSQEFLDDETRMTEVKRLIAKLLHEDELRGAAFVVVINDRKTDAEDEKGEAATTNVDAFRDQLGLTALEPSIPRLLTVHFDCSEISVHHESWKKILNHIWKTGIIPATGQK
mmetsp:Transcript_58346/g.190286  ORF Transcript_58346/g.190286 Transcript_58346/m.190286 type:complete len:222 (+) Transcript_58346:200-865(+)